MAATVKHINVEQMIDLACGTPEAGVINFNALHAFLHIVAKQLQLDNYRIEFGDGCKQINRMISRLSTRPSIDIAKFSVRDTDAAGNYADRKPIKADVAHNATQVDTLLVVRRRAQKLSPETSKTTAAVTEANDGFPLEPIAVPTETDFRKLHSEATQPITDSISELLPTSRELIGSLGEPNSITDMYDMLNLTKRLDAAETMIKKLLQMLADMGQEYNRVGERLHKSTEHNVQMIREMEQKLHNESSHTTIVVPAPPQVDLRELPDVNGNDLDKLRIDLDYIRIAVQRLAQCCGLKDVNQFLSVDLTATNCAGRGDVDLVPLATMHSTTAAAADSASNFGGNRADEETVQKVQTLERGLELLELRQVTTDKRLYELENDLSDVSDRVDALVLSIEQQADQELDAAAMSVLINNIKGTAVQNSERITALMVTRDTMTMITDELAKKLDRLEAVKCDRDEVDELLAEKADYNLVQRKVSNDHFDATKRELGNGLGELLARLADQEDGQRQQLDELRDELESRPSREDVDALKELLVTRLQAMQERIKSMDVRKSDPEAAGTKSRFLRDVQCLSCEQSVVMRKEEPTQGVPRTAAMLAFKSLKPQLTYELDLMRKDMAQGAGGVGRNMHHFEKMYGTMAGKAAGAVEKAHLCARYCGGSHTAVSANERRAKMSHGAGSAIKRKADKLVHGVDGSIYKGGAAEMEPCNCADTMPSRTLPPAEKSVKSASPPSPTMETFTAPELENSSKALPDELNNVVTDVSTTSSVSFAPSSVYTKAPVKASALKSASTGGSSIKAGSSSTKAGSVTLAPKAGSFASGQLTASKENMVSVSRTSSAPVFASEETTITTMVMPSMASSSNILMEPQLMVSPATTDVLSDPTEVLINTPSGTEINKTATESVILKESAAQVDLARPDI